MWHHLLHSKILFDRQGRYRQLQDDYDIPFPQELKNRIITRQLQLLENSMPAFPQQIKKALQRGDLVAVNHRVSEFLASYFELLLTLNEQTHPGEKRLLTYAQKTCPYLPQHFEENLQALFTHLFDAKNTEIVAEMVANLHEVVEAVYWKRPDFPES